MAELSGPLGLLVRLAQVRQDPNATIDDLLNAQRALTEFCETEGLEWEYGEQGQPYLVIHGWRAELTQEGATPPAIEALWANFASAVNLVDDVERARRALIKALRLAVGDIPGALVQEITEQFEARRHHATAHDRAMGVEPGTTQEDLQHALRGRTEGIAEGLRQQAETARRDRLIRPAYIGMNFNEDASGYLFEGVPCGHDFVVWTDMEEWTTHIFYCPFGDCGAGYSLAFDDDGNLEGLEPFAG